MADGASSCPNCKKEVAAGNYNLHVAHCQGRFKLCQLCNEPVLFKQMIQHVEEMHVIIVCEKCGVRMERWQLDDHEESCLKRLKTCQYCDNIFPFDELWEHEKTCGARSEKCRNCKEYVLIRDKINHFEKSCTKRLINCCVCNHKFPYDEFKQHYGPCVTGKKIELVEGKGNILKKSLIETKSEFSKVYESGYPPDRCEDKQDNNFDYSNRQFDENDNNCGGSGKLTLNGDKNQCQLEKSHRKEQEICPSCGLTFFSEEFNNHLRSCDAHVFICSYCNEDVLVKDAANHSKVCSKMLSLQNTKERNRNETQSVNEMENRHKEEDFVVTNLQLLASQRSDKDVKNSEIHDATASFVREHRTLNSVTDEQSQNVMPELDSHSSRVEPFHEYCDSCKNEFPLKHSLDHQDSCRYRGASTVVAEEVSREKEEFPSYTDGSLETSKSAGLRSGSENRNSLNKRENMAEISQLNNQTTVAEEESMLCTFCGVLFPCDVLDLHLVHCGNRKFVCPECNAVMTYFDRKDHVEYTCLKHKAVQKFPDGSRGSKAERRIKEGHSRENSRMENVQCEFCKHLVLQSRFSQHIEHCGNRVFKCPMCTSFLTYFDKKEHHCFTTNAVQNHTGGFHQGSKIETKDNMLNERKMANIRREDQFCYFCNEYIPYTAWNNHTMACGYRDFRCSECGMVLRRKDKDFHDVYYCRYYPQNQDEKKKKDSYFSFSTLKKVIFGDTNEDNSSPVSAGRYQEGSYASQVTVPHTNKGYTRRKDLSQSYSVNTSARTTNAEYRTPVDNMPISTTARYRTPAASAPIYPADVYVPCEFCNRPVLADELIEHESGCRPDLCSYVKDKQNENSSSERDPAPDGATAYPIDVDGDGKCVSHHREDENSPDFPCDVNMKEAANLQPEKEYEQAMGLLHSQKQKKTSHADTDQAPCGRSVEKQIEKLQKFQAENEHEQAIGMLPQKQQKTSRADTDQALYGRSVEEHQIEKFQCVEVELEVGHLAYRRNPMADESINDWLVSVRVVSSADVTKSIQHFIEKVVFYLPANYTERLIVVEEPPYQLGDSGYESFTMPIEIYLRCKMVPKKFWCHYHLKLSLDDQAVENIQRTKLTFEDPAVLHQMLIQAEGSEAKSEQGIGLCVQRHKKNSLAGAEQALRGKSLKESEIEEFQSEAKSEQTIGLGVQRQKKSPLTGAEQALHGRSLKESEIEEFQPVEVELELGHIACMKNSAAEEFINGWYVFVRGTGSGSNAYSIQHFIDKVVFYLPESYRERKRVIREPPYQVIESGYSGFIMNIEIYFRCKAVPKRVYQYDLWLSLDGRPVENIQHLKLTFENPTEDFRRQLIEAGGYLLGASGPTNPSQSQRTSPLTKYHVEKHHQPARLKKSTGAREKKHHSSSEVRINTDLVKNQESSEKDLIIDKGRVTSENKKSGFLYAGATVNPSKDERPHNQNRSHMLEEDPNMQQKIKISQKKQRDSNNCIYESQESVVPGNNSNSVSSYHLYACTKEKGCDLQLESHDKNHPECQKNECCVKEKKQTIPITSYNSECPSDQNIGSKVTQVGVSSGKEWGHRESRNNNDQEQSIHEQSHLESMEDGKQQKSILQQSNSSEHIGIFTGLESYKTKQVNEHQYRVTDCTQYIECNNERELIHNIQGKSICSNQNFALGEADHQCLQIVNDCTDEVSKSFTEQCGNTFLFSGDSENLKTNNFLVDDTSRDILADTGEDNLKNRDGPSRAVAHHNSLENTV